MYIHILILFYLKNDEELSLNSNDESNESTKDYNCISPISPIGQDDYFEGLMYNNIDICEKEVLDEDNFNFIDGNHYDDSNGVCSIHKH